MDAVNGTCMHIQELHVYSINFSVPLRSLYLKDSFGFFSSNCFFVARSCMLAYFLEFTVGYF